MKKAVRIWLVIGVILVLGQIVIGGITRLTGSGLSITRWEIVTGTIPPLNESGWEEAFDLYRETPQYQKINRGMDMKEFKFIYFWEYLHRAWARMIGLVFLFPFVYFLWKGWIDKKLGRQLAVVIVLAMVVATFGWIMVASGLVERPWVNAYKLTLHLGLGTALFLYLWYVALDYAGRRNNRKRIAGAGYIVLFILVIAQILLGGMMSGVKACLFYATWPAIDGSWIPGIITKMSEWKWVNFTNYDQNAFVPALVQFLHRMTAYLLVIWSVILFIRRRTYTRQEIIFLFFLILQVLLGIFTLLQCKGTIPVFLGVGHQLVGMLVAASLVYILKSGTLEKG